MQRTEPAEAWGDSLAMQQQADPSCWSALCSTCWPCCPFFFWSSATFALRAPLAQEHAIHSPAVFGYEFAHRWIAQNGDLPGADFHRSRRQQVVITGSAALLPPMVVEEGWDLLCSVCGFSLRSQLAPFRRRGYVNHSGLARHPHRGTSPVIRPARAGRSKEIVPQCPRRRCAAPNGRHGGFADQGLEILEGQISKNCQRNIHLVRNFYMRCSLTTTHSLPYTSPCHYPSSSWPRPLHTAACHTAVPARGLAAFAPD
jgi:hypothetical protein